MVKKLLLLVAIAYTIALVIVSFINLYNVPNLGSGIDDKIYHVIAYLGLSFLWLTFFKSRKSKRINVVIVISTMLFGAIIETFQHVINPNRTFDLLDIVANCTGVLFGTLIAIIFRVFKLK